MKHQAHLKCLHQHSQQQSELKQAEVRLENPFTNKKPRSSYTQPKGGLALLVKSVRTKKQALQQISALVDSHKERLETYEKDLKQVGQDGRSEGKKIPRRAAQKSNGNESSSKGAFEDER